MNKSDASRIQWLEARISAGLNVLDERIVRTTLLPLGTETTAKLMKAGYDQAMQQARLRWGQPMLDSREEDFLTLARGRYGGRIRNAESDHWFSDRGAFLILPGATNVRYLGSVDAPCVAYELREPYPAVETRNTIESRLKSADWIALPNDLVGSFGTKRRREWVTEKLNEWDATSVDVLRWRDQWMHMDGSAIQVVLKYAATHLNCEGIDRSPLSVDISWISKDRLEVLTALH